MQCHINRFIICLLMVNSVVLYASDGDYQQGFKEGHPEGATQGYAVGLKEGQKRIAPYERNSKATYIPLPKQIPTKHGPRKQFLHGWLEGYQKGWSGNYHNGYRAGLDLPAIHEEETEETSQKLFDQDDIE